jgi:hypothetical protein
VAGEIHPDDTGWHGDIRADRRNPAVDENHCTTFDHATRRGDDPYVRQGVV